MVDQVADKDYPELETASKYVNRGVFCPSQSLREKFDLSPCPLVENKATLSAFPVHWQAGKLIVDHWLQYGRPKHFVRILDVGSGSGYLVVQFAKLLELMKLEGEVIGIELLPELVEFSRRQICQFYPEFNITIHQGDGWLGEESKEQFDVINVGAASEGLPKLLFQQLAPGGIMIIPLQCRSGEQYMYTITKSSDGQVVAKRGIPVRYVPLIPTGGVSTEFEC
jgi:protein-L-isoaspartate(D-aspartate) O-methyltransferase